LKGHASPDAAVAGDEAAAAAAAALEGVFTLLPFPFEGEATVSVTPLLDGTFNPMRPWARFDHRAVATHGRHSRSMAHKQNVLECTQLEYEILKIGQTPSASLKSPPFLQSRF
jgi:hypothetical protein